MRTVKCVVVGDRGVGKTCLLINYTSNQFPEGSVPDLFDNYSVATSIDGQMLNISLVDTLSNHEKDHRLRPLSYPQTDVFLICFKVSAPYTFRNVKEAWLPEIDWFCPGIPFIIVGTQTDLRNDDRELERLTKRKESPVNSTDGEQLANELGAAAYVECSALTRHGIRNVFDTTIRAALDPPPLVKRRKCIAV
ncbi:P-loop containing nucleoside triphosphate hydrolase protein [Auriculariales sp. MPI-PUGE-AT-0066]|nr:P-loop containing nucleoside triphosphate hydrolase protein [Auriculariales sp. MPI-PUGE-AT-0066]